MISTGAAAQQTAENGLFFSGIKRKKQGNTRDVDKQFWPHIVNNGIKISFDEAIRMERHRRMKKKGIIAIVLAFVISAFMLTGCDNNNKPSSSFSSSTISISLSSDLQSASEKVSNGVSDLESDIKSGIENMESGMSGSHSSSVNSSRNESDVANGQ